MYCSCRVKGFVSSMPWHAVFAFLNPLLIGLLQVKFQGTSVSPFDTNPAQFHTFLLATLVYCLAFATHMKCRRGPTNYTSLSGHMALISGSLSSISLVSIFLPRLLGRLILLSWIILLVIVSRQLIFCVFLWTYQRISKVILQLYLRVVNGFNMKYGNNEQEQLPV